MNYCKKDDFAGNENVSKFMKEKTEVPFREVCVNSAININGYLTTTSTQRQ